MGRSSFLVVIALAALLFTGCSIPRAAELCVLGTANADYPSDAKKTYVGMNPCPAESFPNVEVQYDVPVPADQAMEFAKTRLEQRGWGVWDRVGTMSQVDDTHRQVTTTFKKWDYVVRLSVEGVRTSVEAPETSHVWLFFESRHPWDVTAFPRFVAWGILDGPWLAWLF